MPNSQLDLLISGISTNGYMAALFIFTAVTIITVMFAEGILTPLTDAILSILKFVIVAVLTWLTKPIRNAIARIPPYVQTGIYFLLGITIVLLDHRYGVAWFTTDETIPFYTISVQGAKYWVSLYALAAGGFFLGLAALRTVSAIVSWILNFLDRTIQLSFVFYK